MLITVCLPSGTGKEGERNKEGDGRREDFSLFGIRRGVGIFSRRETWPSLLLGWRRVFFVFGFPHARPGFSHFVILSASAAQFWFCSFLFSGSNEEVEKVNRQR